MLAGALTLFLLAQAGVPLTGGFVAKLGVFSAAVDQKQYILALIGMIATVDRRVRLPAHHPHDVRAGDDDEEQPAVRARVDYRHAARDHDRGRRGALPRHPAGGMLDFAKDASQLLAR